MVAFLVYSGVPLLAGVVMAAFKRRPAPIVIGAIGSWPLPYLALCPYLPPDGERVRVMSELLATNPLVATPLVLLAAAALPVAPRR